MERKLTEHEKKIKISRAYSPLLQKKELFYVSTCMVFLTKVKCSSSEWPQMSVLSYFQEQPQGRSLEISLHSFVFYFFSA